MNLENFAEFLKYPSRLYQLPYEELKSLTLQYPYCTNFHMLLLIKSKLEGHPDLEKNLAKAATYSVDRSFLRQIMLEEQLLPLESQLNIGEDEVLELKDLLTLESELEKIAVRPGETSDDSEPGSISFDLLVPEDDEVAQQEDEMGLSDIGTNQGETSQPEVSDPSPAESFSEEPGEPLVPEISAVVPEDVKDHSNIGVPDAAAEGLAFVLAPETIPMVSTMVSIAASIGAVTAVPSPESSPAEPEPEVFLVPEDTIQESISIAAVVSNWWTLQENTATMEWDIQRPTEKLPDPVAAGPAPIPKSRFKSYKRTYRRPLAGNDHSEPTAPEPVPHQVRGAKKVAEESVREDLGVASETLAGLLVQQHQYDRAIKMYEHLSLLIPEKNTYFAAKIDEIKNL